MSLSVSIAQSPVVSADTRALLASLDELFATTFELHHVPRHAAANDLASEAQAARAPRAVVDEGGGCRLAIPRVSENCPLTVAVAHVPSLAPDHAERVALLWLKQRETELHAAQCDSENMQLAEQIADDLEELTFLRTMVEKLDVGDAAQDLMSLADSTLPMLCESVQADGLCLLRNLDEGEPLYAVPARWFGTHKLSDTVVSRVLQWFGESALSRPVVKNFLAQSPEGSLLPGIDQFILVPLESPAHRLGWLLAIRESAPPDRGRDGMQREFGSSEASLLVTSATILASHARNLQLYQEKEQMIVGVVRAMVSAIEAKDDYTRGHSERVARYAQELARHVGYDAAACERVYLTGLVHDLGKIGVSDAVLKKADRLSALEFAEIKRHPEEGWAILHELRSLGYVLPGVLYHHERWDGQGYPDGLAGDRIPMDGRLLSVVDAYDAMTSDRPYRKGMPVEQAQALLRDGAGRQWDPAFVDAFFADLPAIEAIRTTYQPSQRPLRLPGVIDRGCQAPPRL